MTWRQAIAGMLQFFAVLFFIGVGLFGVALSFNDDLAYRFSESLMGRPDLFAWFGFGAIGAGALLTLGFLSVHRGRTLLLRMGASVDTKILRQSIAQILEKQFAARLALSHLRVEQGRHLEIGLELGSMNEEERKKLLLEAERHLQTLLSERFGYRKPFTVQATSR